jgi:hypothetical protein
MHLDADLTAFLLTVGVIVFGSLPALRANSASIPVRYDFEEIPTSKLTESQAAFFSSYDEKLAAMGYYPTCTYRVRNYVHNLMRSYYNGAETSRCVVMVVELTSTVGNVQSLGATSLLSFHTQYADGRMLTTRNMKLKSVLDRPPFLTIQDVPSISDPVKMKALHDARAQELGCPISPPSTADAVFSAVQEEHDRFSDYQIAQGIYEAIPGGHYRLTNKPFRRSIHNFLNPFVHRIPLYKLIPVSILGATLPVIGIAWLAPAMAEAARTVGFPPSIAAHIIILASYMSAGVVIGYVFEQHCFVWVFLITYVAVHLAGLNPGGTYSAFAGLVAHYVGQAKNRKRAILIPQPIKARAATAAR